MDVPGLMTPQAIEKELARRREQLEQALRYGRSNNAQQHQARIAALENAKEIAARLRAEYEASRRERKQAGGKEPAAAAEGAAHTPEPACPAAGQAHSANQLPTLPNETPDDAVATAERLLAKWGATAAVRALQIALSNAGPIKASIDVADGVRLVQMRKRVGA